MACRSAVALAAQKPLSAKVAIRGRSLSTTRAVTTRVAAPKISASFHDFSAKTLGSGTRDAPVDGEEVSFSTYAGKVKLVVNIASL